MAINGLEINGQHMNDATKAEFQRALSGLHNTLLVVPLTEGMGKGERAALLLTPSFSIHLFIFSFSLVSSYPLLSRRKVLEGSGPVFCICLKVIWLVLGRTRSQSQEPKPAS